jgi:hypothetical protein
VREPGGDERGAATVAGRVCTPRVTPSAAQRTLRTSFGPFGTGVEVASRVRRGMASLSRPTRPERSCGGVYMPGGRAACAAHAGVMARNRWEGDVGGGLGAVCEPPYRTSCQMRRAFCTVRGHRVRLVYGSVCGPGERCVVSQGLGACLLCVGGGLGRTIWPRACEHVCVSARRA